tara:strand:- start:65 stop:250 length:186 start_codon:yes stop_codon:yes gene_type:complete
MKYHPLRNTFNKDDLIRLQDVIDKKTSEDHATIEELNAAHDIFYDAIAGSLQTHLGITTLQ